MKYASICVVAMAAFSSSTFADQQQDRIEEFKELVRANTYEVSFDGEHVSGPGVDWLIREGRAAQYFLVGERHGLAEVPKVSGDIFERLMANGYSHAALEFGPFAATITETHLNDGGFDQLAAYLSAGPGKEGPVAFLDWIEEAEMVTRLHAISPMKEGFLWGLDQEFFGGFGAHLKFLRDHSNTKEQRAAIAAMEANRELDNALFLNTAPSEMKALTNLFRSSTNAEVLSLLDLMEISNFIYGPWAKPSRIPRAQSNMVRENHMKDNFMKYLRQAKAKTGEDPKVFFKFGGFHSAPSIDLRNARITLGMFIEEFARSRGQSAFNLFIDCIGGARPTSGQDEDQKSDKIHSCENGLGPIDPDAPWDDNKNMLSDLLMVQDKVLLVDLRPVRMKVSRFHRILSDASKQVIAGFDAYMALPNVTVSASFDRGN